MLKDGTFSSPTTVGMYVTTSVVPFTSKLLKKSRWITHSNFTKHLQHFRCFVLRSMQKSSFNAYSSDKRTTVEFRKNNKLLPTILWKLYVLVLYVLRVASYSAKGQHFFVTNYSMYVTTFLHVPVLCLQWLRQ